MAQAGRKRASPGAEEPKNMFDIEITDEQNKIVDQLSKDVMRVELANERAAFKRLAPLYEKRREAVKALPKFWPVTLMNFAEFVPYCQHLDDQKALLALEDLWVERDPREPRTFTLEFHFGENPYFEDKVLKKEFRFMAPPALPDDKADENGIKDSDVEFDWERDVSPQKIKISWKGEKVNLTKLHPRLLDESPESFELVEPGSFFNLFETESDPFEIGLKIANDIFPDAPMIYSGKMPMDLTDDEDSEDDEEDDDDAEEIDLEKPEPKKQRKA